MVQENEMALPTEEIVVYGTSWCYETRRARNVLDLNHIAYRWVDVEKDPEASEYVKRINRGYRSVPTIVFPDGSILVEPSETELKKKLILD
jgi:mycoredoxin